MPRRLFCSHDHWREETLWNDVRLCGVEGCTAAHNQPHRTGTVGRRCLKCGRFGSLEPTGLYGENRWVWRTDAR